MHLSDEPIMDKITVDTGEMIDPVDPIVGYSFLGFLLSYSNDIIKIILNNLNKKMVNTVKFYSWLEYNEDSPFFVKIDVLYTCLFAALLYSIEAWGDVKKLESKLLKIEREALKRCLGVKNGTTNDLVYIELRKADIIANIKDRQRNFYEKIMTFEPEFAVVRSIWNLVASDERTKSFTDYYKSLEPGNKSKNISDRRSNVTNSESSMCTRYVNLVGMEYSEVLYNSSLIDSKRKIITRWRLSSHKLKIETGRYTKPKTDPQERKCTLCDVIDDERHAMFECIAHRLIRQQYTELLQTRNSVKKMLNPTSIEEATKVANYLSAIEENMET